MSGLLADKTNKYEYLIEEETLIYNQRQLIEQSKFIYSPLEKAFEKQAKTSEDQGKKQVDILNTLKPKEQKQLNTSLMVMKSI